MKTKEAILTKLSQDGERTTSVTHTYIEDYAGGSDGYYREDVTLSAMEEHAREIAIDFAIWINKGWATYENDNEVWHEKLRISKPYKIEQLFDLYLQETKSKA